MKIPSLFFLIFFVSMISTCSTGPGEALLYNSVIHSDSTIVFTGVNLITMEDDSMLTGQTVVVRDGKIQQTSKSGSLTIPENAVVLDAAEFLGAENEMGTITPGKQANLVLLNANPLVDIKNTTRIEGIVLNGEWIPETFFK